jgi:hypothetical protein
VISKLTLLHIVLAVMASGGVYLAWREVRRVYVSQWRLLVPPALGLGVALGLALIQIRTAQQPGWTFVVALLVGLGAGWMRGNMMRFDHDLYRPKLVMSPVGRFGLLGTALVVAAATAVDILATRSMPALEPVRYGAALVAMVCAAAMLGRAISLAAQLNRYYAHLKEEESAAARVAVRPQTPPTSPDPPAENPSSAQERPPLRVVRPPR